MMQAFEAHLRRNQVPGYHLYASSYHYEGVAFYPRLGLDELGWFEWRFHDGFRWLTVTEHVFVRELGITSPEEAGAVQDPG